MRRLAYVAGCLAGCFAVGLALGGAAPADAGPWSIVAERSGGAVVAARPLPPGGVFAIAYEHSAYRAPTVELFRAAGTRFTMYAVASPNEAVLDYYELDGPRAPALGWWVQRPERPGHLADLSLIATPVGRRMLVAASECLPLHPRTGSYDLRILIARHRAAGRTAPCPPAVPRMVRAVPPRP